MQEAASWARGAMEDSIYDLVSHRGSCFHRQKIKKEELNLRRGYMGSEPRLEIDTFSDVWLSNSPAEFWTRRAKQAREAAGSTSALVLNSPVRHRGPVLPPHPTSVLLSPQERMPITTSERAAWAAKRRLEVGPSAADRASMEMQQLLRDDPPQSDSRESVGMWPPGTWPLFPRGIEGMPMREVQVRSRHDMHQCVARSRGLGGTILRPLPSK